MTETQTSTRGTETVEDAEPHKKKSSPSDNMAWAKSTGAKRYNPTLHDQTKWRRFRCWPVLIRLDAWLEGHTSDWPILSAYAVDREGYELHIENFAEDEGVDEANARKAWRHGVRMGVWGNKPHPDSKPKDKYLGRRRMYRYGTIDLARAEQESERLEPEPQTEEDKNRFAQTFFGCIWNKIKDRPKEEINAWIAEETIHRQAVTDTRADIDAAWRLFIAHKEHARWESRGVRANGKQQHKFKNGHAAAHAARQQLVQQFYLPNLEPILAAALDKRFAQTSEKSAQDSETGLRKHEEKVCASAASLLGQRDSEIPRSLIPTSDLERACESVKTPPVEQKSLPKEQHTGTGSEAQPEEQQAIDLLFTKTREMQNQFPHTKFGSDLVTPDNKADRVWARRVVEQVTPAEVENFCLDLQVKLGLARPALGLLPKDKKIGPGHNPHERYIGLILEWAGDWRRNEPERKKQYQADREAKERRDAISRRQQEEAARTEAEWQKLGAAWSALPAESRDAFLENAKASLHADPTFMKMNLSQRKAQIELYAKKLLRASLDADAGARGE